ncbi:alanine racemase [Idiomarina sp. HP20-50]|uniref:alanine racemase n=1 Tax=Idiomarina sp. HP20-50 TaxID=3070813 RepID=UPI00294B27E2|nr:alanine racemase [Idiomarina sp. HP20-50]MDV6316469.1 alanine racemase [Idiomarina sp. HP20-50]
MHYRQTRAEISSSAIQHNAKWVRRAMAGGKLLGVVKADGYGHGVGPAVQALTPYVDGMAAGFMEEALAVRDSGYKGPVVILEGCFSNKELTLCCEQQLSPVVHCEQQLQAIEQAKLRAPLWIWLKVDTGMHRLGWSQEQAQQALSRLQSSDNVAGVTLMSHLANADAEHSLNAAQKQLFYQLSGTLSGYQARSFHNSAGLLNPATQWALQDDDWARAGLLLYGVNPSTVTEVQPELQPAMRLVAPVIALHKLKRGESVGYGSGWSAEKPSVIATVAMGYADGYPRQAKNGTPAMIRGHRVGLAGRVSMDMLTIDVTGIDDVQLGDDVELWGPDVDVRQVAACADTISWHLLTGVSGRVPRVLL